jgi:hypothetical protein
MVLTSYSQTEILHQMKIERLRAVREQAKYQSLNRTSNYCENKLYLKRQIHAEKRKENIQNQQKDRQKLEQKLHRVLLDTGAGHDAAHHFKKAELARQQRLVNRTEKLQKRQVHHAQEAAHRLQLEQQVAREAHQQALRLASQREEQSLLDREAAHLQAESMAASQRLLARSKQREDTLVAQAAHNHQQQYSEQGAISILQRGRVVVQARVTRHGASTEHDSAIVVNQSETFKDNLNKSHKDNVLKELISRHVIKARNQQAKKASIDNNAFSSIEQGFALLSSLDRANDRRNRVKNTEDVRRQETQQKDTRLTGGSGRNPAAYNALLRQNFEKDFFDGEGSSSKRVSSSAVRGARGEEATEHSHYAWQKAAAETQTRTIATTVTTTTTSLPADRRKAKTDTGLAKRVPVSPPPAAKKPWHKPPPARKTALQSDPLPPQWRPVPPAAQSLSSGLLGQPTLVPAQVASFLTLEDPYLGVGAKAEASSSISSPSSSSSAEGDLLGDQNVYELLAGMQGEAARVVHQTEQALQQQHEADRKQSALDAVHTTTTTSSSSRTNTASVTTLKAQRMQAERERERQGQGQRQTGDGPRPESFNIQMMSTHQDSSSSHADEYVSGDDSNVMYSFSSSSTSSGSSGGSSTADDESKQFQHVFELDAVHSQSQSQSQPPSAQTFSPAAEYVPAQLLHEPVGDVRAGRPGSRERGRVDAFPLGNDEDVVVSSAQTAGAHVLLDSMSSSESDREGGEGGRRQEAVVMSRRSHSDGRGGQAVEEVTEQSVALEALDLSDDSLR